MFTTFTYLETGKTFLQDMDRLIRSYVNDAGQTVLVTKDGEILVRETPEQVKNAIIYGVTDL